MFVLSYVREGPLIEVIKSHVSLVQLAVTFASGPVTVNMPQPPSFIRECLMCMCRKGWI